MALGDGAMANFWGMKLGEEKSKFGGFYVTGAIVFFASADMDIGIGIAFGFFILLFTVLAHLIVKIVAVQNQVAGNGPTSTGIGSMFHSTNHSSFAGGYHYNQMIRRLKSQSVQGMTADQASTQFAEFFSEGRKSSVPFFANPNVQSVLGIVNSPAQTIITEQVQPAIKESSASGAFWSGMSESASSDVEICAGQNCTTSVTVFDFRCFNCRKRFCNGCKGDKVTCPSCS